VLVKFPLLVSLFELPDPPMMVWFVPFVELLLLELFTTLKLHVGQNVLISILNSIVIHATIASRPAGTLTPVEVLFVDWVLERVVFRVTRPLGPKNIRNQLVVLVMIDERPLKSATTSSTEN